MAKSKENVCLYVTHTIPLDLFEYQEGEHAAFDAIKSFRSSKNFNPPAIIKDALSKHRIFNLNLCEMGEFEEVEPEQKQQSDSAPFSMSIIGYAECNLEVILSPNIKLLFLPESNLGQHENFCFEDDSYMYFTHSSTLIPLNDDKTLDSESLISAVKGGIEGFLTAPLGYLRLLNGEYDGDPTKYSEDFCYDPQIKVIKNSDTFLVKPPSFVRYGHGSDDQYLLEAHASLRERVSDILGVPTEKVDIEVLSDGELEPVMLTKNVWLEALIIPGLKKQSGSPYWWNHKDWPALKEQLSTSEGFAKWLADQGADNISYYSFLRGEDGMEVMYACQVFKGRKSLCSFIVTPFDFDAGADWIDSLNTLMSENNFDDISISHAGEKEFDWDTKMVLEEDIISFGCPSSPPMPLSGFSLGFVIVKVNEEEGKPSGVPYLNAQPLSNFPSWLSVKDFVQDNENLHIPAANGIVLPPLPVRVNSDGQTLNTKSVYDIITQAFEDSYSIKEPKELHTYIRNELSMDPSPFVWTSIIISDIKDQEYLDDCLSFMSFVKTHGLSENWIREYKSLFPSMDLEPVFFVPYFKE